MGQESGVRGRKSEDGEGIPQSLNSSIPASQPLLNTPKGAPVQRGKHPSIPESHHSRIPIIALSAAVMEDDRRRAREAGMDGHVAKPISSAELYRTMLEWLKEQGEEQPAAGMPPGEVSEDEAVLPESLEGFDIKDGLRRFEGDATFYLKMLHKFNRQLEDEFTGMPEMLQELDQQDEAQVKVVSRMAHTLKGLAAMVGATSLTDAAWAIDQAFKDNSPIAGELRMQLAQNLGLELNQVRGQLAGLPGQHVQRTVVSEEEAVPAMKRLLAGLRAGELVDEELLATVTGFLLGKLGQDQIMEFNVLVENFELDRAADLLEDLAGQEGVDLS